MSEHEQMDKSLALVAQLDEYTNWIKLGIKQPMFKAYYKNLELCYAAGMTDLFNNKILSPTEKEIRAKTAKEIFDWIESQSSHEGFKIVEFSLNDDEYKDFKAKFINTPKRALCKK